LSEGKCKTIAFYWRWSFLLLVTPKMANLRSSRIALTILILCLCLGSLVVLPIMNVVNPSALEIFGIDSGYYNPLEQAESDDDLVVASILDKTNVGLVFSKSRTMNLDFQSASLASVSPPPKHT